VGGTYSKSQYNASFVGFFPADNPQIAMIVALDSLKVFIMGFNCCSNFQKYYSNG
jgi:cell division protein FtsI/penicillin-binding protein 2